MLTEKMAMAGNSFSPDFHMILSKMHDPEKIADFILSHLNLKRRSSQELLGNDDLTDLLEGIISPFNKRN